MFVLLENAATFANLLTSRSLQIGKLLLILLSTCDVVYLIVKNNESYVEIVDYTAACINLLTFVSAHCFLADIANPPRNVAFTLQHTYV